MLLQWRMFSWKDVTGWPLKNKNPKELLKVNVQHFRLCNCEVEKNPHEGCYIIHTGGVGGSECVLPRVHTGFLPELKSNSLTWGFQIKDSDVLVRARHGLFPLCHRSHEPLIKDLTPRSAFGGSLVCKASAPETEIAEVRLLVSL